MEIAVLQPHRQRGPVFVREVKAGTLVLIPHSPLGNLHEGEIAEETTELVEIINHSGPTSLVIDLQNGDYLGSAFLGAIVRLGKRVALRGGRLALCNVSHQIMEILRVTRFETSWPIYASRDEALGAMGA